jgi:hypothetical protein
VAPLSAIDAADIRIYKATDGAAFSNVQRTSANGITSTSPFDTLTGFHEIDIDLTDNSDAGFYAAGCLYAVVLSPTDETIDGQTITGVVLGYFEIGVQPANVTQFGGSAGTFSGGRPEVNTTHVGGTSQTAGDIIGDTNDIQARLPAALGANGNIKADVRDYSGTAGTFSSGRPEVNTTHWKGTAAATVDSAGYPVVTVKDGTGAGEINTNGGKVVGVELVDVLTTYTGNTPQTGDSFARLGAAGAGLTDLGGMSTTMKGQVQTEAKDALVTHRLDELLNADSDIDGAAPPTVGSVFHELMTKTAGSFTYDQTTDSNEALRDRGDAAWTTATGFSTHSAADVWAVATRTLTAFDASFKTGYALSTAGVQAIWDALTSVLTTVGSIGKLLVDNINATIASRLPTFSYTAPLDAAGTRSALGLASANLDTQLAALAALIAALNNLSAADVLTQINAALDQAVADSIPADGSRPSVRQAAYMHTQFLLERSVSGTTLTVKKPDGVTTLFTVTLNDATTPTALTRAS